MPLPPPIEKPDVLIKISVVTLVLSAIVVTTPVTLTLISVYSVQNTIDKYVPDRMRAEVIGAAKEFAAATQARPLEALEDTAVALQTALQGAEDISPPTPAAQPSASSSSGNTTVFVASPGLGLSRSSLTWRQLSMITDGVCDLNDGGGAASSWASGEHTSWKHAVDFVRRRLLGKINAGVRIRVPRISPLSTDISSAGATGQPIQVNLPASAAVAILVNATATSLFESDDADEVLAGPFARDVASLAANVTDWAVACGLSTDAITTDVPIGGYAQWQDEINMSAAEWPDVELLTVHLNRETHQSCRYWPLVDEPDRREIQDACTPASFLRLHRKAPRYDHVPTFAPTVPVNMTPAPPFPDDVVWSRQPPWEYANGTAGLKIDPICERAISSSASPQVVKRATAAAKSLRRSPYVHPVEPMQHLSGLYYASVERGAACVPGYPRAARTGDVDWQRAAPRWDGRRATEHVCGTPQMQLVNRSVYAAPGAKRPGPEMVEVPLYSSTNASFVELVLSVPLAVKRRFAFTSTIEAVEPRSVAMLQYIVRLQRSTIRTFLEASVARTGVVLAIVDFAGPDTDVLACASATDEDGDDLDRQAARRPSPSETGCGVMASIADHVRRGESIDDVGIPTGGALSGVPIEGFSHLLFATKVYPTPPPCFDDETDASGFHTRSSSPSSSLENWYIVAGLPTRSYLELVLFTRARIVVTAFTVGAVSVILMLLMMRSLMYPLRALTRAIGCCASMQLDKMELMEASSVAEIAEIQRSVAYLAIRLYHYQRFLPDRLVLDCAIGDLDDEFDESGQPRVKEARDTPVVEVKRKSLGANAAIDAAERQYDNEDFDVMDDEEEITVDGDAARKAEIAQAAEDLAVDPKELDELLAATAAEAEEEDEDGAPVHTIQVNCTYETLGGPPGSSEELLHRLQAAPQGPTRLRNRPHRNAKFTFRYRATDAVHTALLRKCRVNLNERPGEVLMIFVQTPDGKRQLTNNEDVLFAIEYFANSGDLAALHLTIMKANVRSLLPALIAAATLSSAIARLLLSISRMTSPDPRVQIIGVLLVACLGTQVAQNILVTAYLLGRFSAVDPEFREWRKVSRRECRFAIAVGALNVTNVEVLGSHLRLCGEWLRLTAPLNAMLTQKIRKYSLMGFIVGDLIPFVIIVIETVLRRSYRDPFVVVSLFFSVLSVVSILVRHGIIRFVMDVAVQRNKQSVRNHSTKTMILSRKEVTLMRIGFAEEHALVGMLSAKEIDLLSEAVYTAIAPMVRKYGGLLLSTVGLTFTVAFNAHTVVPAHASAAYASFRAIDKELAKHVKPFVLRVQRNRHRVKYGTKIKFDRGKAATRHRIIASIVSGEMCLGYIGTVTSQSFQHVDELHDLSCALLELNMRYGTTLLVNGTMAVLVHSAKVKEPMLSRRVDRVSLRVVIPSLAMRLNQQLHHIDTLQRRVERTQMEGREDEELDEALAAALAENQMLTGRQSATDVPMALTLVGGQPTSASAAAEHDVHEVILGDLKAPVEDLETLLDDLGEAILDQYTLIGANSVSTSAVHRQRRQERVAGLNLSSGTVESIKRFDKAMEAILTLRNPADVLRYARGMQHDTVAQHVSKWARFLNTLNEAEGVTFPRPVTVLGVQLHNVEVDPRVVPAGVRDEKEDAETAQAAAARRMKAQRELRPSRTERRARAAEQHVAMSRQGAAGGPAAAVSTTSVLEHVIGRENFSVDFVPRSSGPVVDL